MCLKKIFMASLLVGVAFLSGCAGVQPMQVVSNVDSLARADAITKKRYVLIPGGKGIEAGDLQFLEYANYIENILSEGGFVKVAALQDADVAIFLAYAIGDPKTYQYTYSIPTWGQTGVSSARTYGTVSSYGGGATYSGTTTYTPTYGVTGSTTHVGTNTVYSRFLSLDAYDVPVYLKEAKMAQVWKTSAVSAGASGDLRLIVPYMVAAMKPYLGTNTGRRIEVQVPANDPAVQALRGGQPPAIK